MKKDYLRASIKTDKPIVYIDMDGVMCDFDARKAELKKIGVTEHKIWKHPNVFRDLEPIEGAVDAWHAMQPYFETYILSTPPWSSPEAWSDKRKWVETHLGETAKKKLILCHNKGLVKGDYLIDDRIANGVADFTGTHIHFGSEQFPNWESILTHLL